MSRPSEQRQRKPTSPPSAARRPGPSLSESLPPAIGPIFEDFSESLIQAIAPILQDLPQRMGQEVAERVERVLPRIRIELRQRPRPEAEGTSSHRSEGGPSQPRGSEVPAGTDVNGGTHPPAVSTTQADVYDEHRAMQPQTSNLADLLERVLDKGIVIAGDVILSVVGIELLEVKIRLLIASVDKAQQIGIDWWKSDPALSSEARRQQLEDRLELLEARSRGARDEREHLPERDQKKADRNR